MAGDVCPLFYLETKYTVFQKSDAKIQITITMAHLIRINYPLSSFNCRLFGTNFANLNKIHRTVYEQQLFKQEAQLSQRNRAAACLNFDKNISANSVHLTLLYVRALKSTNHHFTVLRHHVCT